MRQTKGGGDSEDAESQYTIGKKKEGRRHNIVKKG